jgi:MIP family channel proteins
LYNRPQKLAAEFVGTFALVFFGVGAIVADQFLRTGGNAQAGMGLLGVALAQGLAVGIMVTALGHISGGHFNPAVTVGFWVTRRFSTFDTLAYGIAQAGGAVAAAYLVRRLPFDAWSAVQLGAPDLARGFSRTNGMILEAVLTFFLVFVYFATFMGERGVFNKISGFAIGLTVTIGVLAGGPYTGAAMNPARALGPAVAANHWTNHGIYWIGPLAGSVAAAWMYDTLFSPKS